ncbi:praja 2, RING-H2 motif containing, isoform CRA_b [Rattus norvegicus]|uniref:RING-type E3 ubiquitin transferase n=2 Tax=Rattus norvegicus TaxID=10116 RepID=A0A0H2UHM9_RAT|nr:E3 ubiquitin-protein ligase Praja-2 isoform 2 [Rattus norvegicus]EDL91827.1 praja 2, RING-H2 motif containing, isoform CRA_b [Rattus norvegicus]|eukprot:NP_001264207.1 E3 ubiquitin-protein ligase Praja-2 isoform 2 [Rattus norvegicus]
MSQYTEKEPSVMDQDSSKAAWPRAAGGYQTITGRRYGRRHAYVSFKPCMTRHERSLGRAGDDYEVLELDDVAKENTAGSSSLDQVHPSLPSETTVEKSETEIPTCGPALNQSTESNPSVATVCHSEEVRETLDSSTNLQNHAERECTPAVCNASSVQNGIVLVHTDSYDPDSKHDENDSLQLCAQAVEGGRRQKVLGNAVFELENGEVERYADLCPSVPSLSGEIREESEELGSALLEKNSAGDAEAVHQDGQEFQRSSEDGIVRKRRQDDTDQGRQTENSTEDADCVPGHVEQNTSERANHHGSSPEQVVRPKVRKVISSSQVDQESGFNRHEAKQRSVQRWREALEVEECSSDDPIIKCDDYDGDHDCMFLTPSYSRVTPREAERHRATAENGATASGRQEARENAFWNACGEYYQLFDKDEDREQTSLEEGEIPWLQYNEVNESSSDEGNEPANEFAQPEAFMLDGNNNLEDDSSVSEDLDVDWSLFDGFADGLGVAEAISYVDPQFLTYMALEERLAQAMETALAHLESLAVDVEVANPPASKESIDGLPETLVLEDHTAIGQEQCCPICCSEYIKDDIATELPCHHFFHKPCVSIWLQKSGTCPVCRRHFPPAVIDASAAASSEPDLDASPANDNAEEAP